MQQTHEDFVRFVSAIWAPDVFPFKTSGHIIYTRIDFAFVGITTGNLDKPT